MYGVATQSFIESLSAKVHPAPLTVASLSDLFQDFYVQASSHISTHVSHLYLSLSSKRAKTGMAEQMLSISEIAQRKKDRKMTELKKIALEEAVERRVTSQIFDKIWRHRSAEDEARDETLRSKTLALGVVGIGLKELGVDESLNIAELKPAVTGRFCAMWAPIHQ